MSRPPRARARGALATVVVVASFGVFAVPAAADPEAKLRQLEERKQRIQAQLEKVERKEGRVLSQFQALDAERASAEARLEATDAELAELDGRLGAVKRRLTRTQQELALITANFNDLEQRLGRRTDVFTERAVAAYKAGPAAYLDSVVTSETFGEAIDRYSYYKAALDSDSELIGRIEVLKDEVETKQRLVEKKQDQIVSAKLELERDRLRIAEIRAERAAALATIRQAADRKSDLLAGVRADRARLERIEAQLERDSDEIQMILAARSSGIPTGTAHGTGQMLWPANGPLTSPYGYRVHPIFGTRKLHTGIDIGSAYGAPVFASDGGEVVYVGTMSGYGNVVVVDHGGGLATTYNHLSAFGVTTGQTVLRGATIAAVGCTGYCTGPHLHFEVRVNGAPVDPMPYLR